MCGIIGIFNNKNAPALALKGLKIIENRGKDAYGISNYHSVYIKKDIESLKKGYSKFLNNNNNINSKNIERNIFAHCLHSIVEFLPQPIKHQGLLIANCEIYNWKTINKKYKLNAFNDSETIIKLIEKNNIKNIKQTLNQLDGVYAFAYWNKNQIILARDILGVKPLWYSTTKGFSFSSEKKVLESYNHIAEELNPREILIYNIKTKKIKKLNKDFFKITPEIKEPLKEIQKKLQSLLENSIKKRIPQKKIGILFSGGIDSTVIALICKNLKVNFTCYTAAVKGIGNANDIEYAKKVAKKYNLKLKIKEINLDQVEPYIKKVAPLIEHNNVVKIGVSLPFYIACEEAKKDNVKVIFSGLGAEELFAGYERHKHSLNINKECLFGLLKLYERDLYRDDLITMNNNIELRLPFLDQQLINYSLKIPEKFKLNNKQNKVIFRQVAKNLGIEPIFYERKKQAAQYGSKFDKAIEKLAKKNNFERKSQYLKKFYNKPNLKLGALFSSGKDSVFALHIMDQQNYEISCLINIKSQNPDSYMFHTPNIDLSKHQAKAMDLPIIQQITKGEKEKELKDLEIAIKKAKIKYKIQGIVTGAIHSTYQRDRIEKICDKLGLKIFNPLWHMDQKNEITQIINSGFKVMVTKIAALGFDQSWLGKILDKQDIDKLVKLHEKYKINIAFEGGEAESLVVDGPNFKKKLIIKEAEKIMEKEYCGLYKINKVELK